MATLADVEVSTFMEPLMMQLISDVSADEVEVRFTYLRNLSPLGQLLPGRAQEARLNHPHSARPDGSPESLDAVDLLHRVTGTARRPQIREVTS